MLTDIGVNLLHAQFAKDRQSVVTRARAAGVSRMLVTATNLEEAAAAAALCAEQGPGLWCTAGVHPHDAKDANVGWQSRLVELVALPQVKAVGEMGLDFHRDFSPRHIQVEVFRAQLAIAADCNKPVFVHDRDSGGMVQQLLNAQAPKPPGVVIHCFTGSREELLGYLDAGHHIGITGWVCDQRRGAQLRELVPLIPLERLLVESDAPFLRPHNAPKAQVKGDRRNEPALLHYVIEQLAQLYGYSPAAIAAASHDNAAALFQLAD